MQRTYLNCLHLLHSDCKYSYSYSRFWHCKLMLSLFCFSCTNIFRVTNDLNLSYLFSFLKTVIRRQASVLFSWIFAWAYKITKQWDLFTVIQKLKLAYILRFRSFQIVNLEQQLAYVLACLEVEFRVRICRTTQGFRFFELHRFLEKNLRRTGDITYKPVTLYISISWTLDSSGVVFLRFFTPASREDASFTIFLDLFVVKFQF